MDRNVSASVTISSIPRQREVLQFSNVLLNYTSIITSVSFMTISIHNMHVIHISYEFNIYGLTYLQWAEMSVCWYVCIFAFNSGVLTTQHVCLVLQHQYVYVCLKAIYTLLKLINKGEDDT